MNIQKHSSLLVRRFPSRTCGVGSRPRMGALMRHVAAVAAMCLVGCSTTPSKPPTVDETTRRPANDAARIEQLRVQLDGERLRTERDLQRRTMEAHRSVEDILTAVARAPVVVAARLAAPGASAGATNTVFTVTFSNGSSQLTLDAAEKSRLVQAAIVAPKVVVRGRTDAELDNLVDARLARERAESMRRLLVAGGVANNLIRVQYQAAGDFVAENQTPQGRALNRRVEVEIYGAAPVDQRSRDDRGAVALGDSAPRGGGGDVELSQ